MTDEELKRYGAAWERLHKSCSELEPQAIEVLAYIAERLVLGRKAYGDMNLETDERNMMKEVAAEAGDLVVYQVMHLLQKAMKEAKLIDP